MKQEQFSLIAIAMALLAVTSAQAGEPRQLQCPDELTPGEVKVTTRAGWQTHVPYSLPLFGAGMSAGSPESEMQLRGEPLDAKGSSTAYRFGGGGPNEERWLDCRYGRSGEFTMSRRLDDKIRQCVIKHHKLEPGNPRRVEIRCS